MRKCRGRYFCQGNYHEFEMGYFHKWGVNYEEFCDSGPGNYSVAIVELPDGRIVMPVANDIVFLESVSGHEN